MNVAKIEYVFIDIVVRVTGNNNRYETLLFGDGQSFIAVLANSINISHSEMC